MAKERRLEQAVGSKWKASDKVVFAKDLAVNKLKHYLCSAGPAYCPRCDSQCAFGQRYLMLKGEERMEEQKFTTSAERARWAKAQLDNKVPEEEVAAAAGFSSVGSMKATISRDQRKGSKGNEAGGDQAGQDAGASIREKIAQDMGVPVQVMEDLARGIAQAVEMLQKLMKMQQENPGTSIRDNLMALGREMLEPAAKNDGRTITLPAGMKIVQILGSYGVYMGSQAEKGLRLLPTSIIPWDQTHQAANELLQAAEILNT